MLLLILIGLIVAIPLLMMVNTILNGVAAAIALVIMFPAARFVAIVAGAALYFEAFRP